MNRQKKKNKPTSGFSLIEIVLAVVILSFSAVALHHSFFSSLNGASHLKNRIEADNIFGDLFWKARALLNDNDPAGRKTVAQEYALDGTEFRGSLDLSAAAGKSDLYKARASVAWQEGARAISLSREKLMLRKPKK